MKNLKDDLYLMTAKLVSHATFPGNVRAFSKIVKYVRGLFPDGFRANLYSSHGRPSLIIKNHPGDRHDLVLAGHLDVAVPRKNSYKAVRKGDKIFGNGAMDMKGSCAVMIKYMLDNALQTPKKLALVLTTDEEMGGKDGTGFLLQKNRLRTKAVFLPDGGYPHQITVAQKGLFFVHLLAKGKKARTISCWHGENAIDILAENLLRIRKLFPQKNLSDKNNWHPTMNPKLVKNPVVDVYNDGVIASSEAVLEINCTDSRTQKEWLTLISRTCPGLRVTVLNTLNIDPYFVSPANAQVRAFRNAAFKVTGQKWPFKKENGSSDARYYGAKKVPVVLTCAKGGRSHLPGEWVSLDSLCLLYKILAKYSGEI